MTAFKSDFLRIMQERGFIHQCTDAEGLDKLMQQPIAAYIGFDCTAPSLHVGSLIQIMILRWLQKTGHKPIVLMGGGTTKVGDPSGKDESRKLLDDAGIQKNMDGIKTVFAKYMTFGSGSSDAMMVNNDDWLSKLNYIEFLRDYGRHFSVNRMMSMDSVKLRLEREQNLSFLEFNYMILQAYDFVELNKRFKCRLQIGGSDQWGNIVQGVQLNRVKLAQERADQGLPTGLAGKGETWQEAAVSMIENQNNFIQDVGLFGLTTPLLTTASGAKMGKTANGAVWLNADQLSPYDYWQFWRNTEDADVGKFLKLFTELSMDEIKKLEALQGSEINEAKKILANEATKLCHGEQAAQESAATAQKVFEQGGLGESLPELEVTKAELEKGIAAFELFVRAELCPSNGEAKKLIQGGGGKLNDQKIDPANRPVTLADINPDGVIKLSAGKKRHVVVRAT